MALFVFIGAFRPSTQGRGVRGVLGRIAGAAFLFAGAAGGAEYTYNHFRSWTDPGRAQAQWKMINKDQPVTTALDEFIKKWDGAGHAAIMVKEARVLRIDASAWEHAAEIRSEDAYAAYLEQFPNGKYAALASTAKNELRDYPKLQGVTCEDSEFLHSFIAKYPKGRFIKRALDQKKEIDRYWKAFATGEIKEYESYLSEYASGRCAENARRQVADARGTPAKIYGDVGDDEFLGGIVWNEKVILYGSAAKDKSYWGRRSWIIELKPDFVRRKFDGRFVSAAEPNSPFGRLLARTPLYRASSQMDCILPAPNDGLLLIEKVLRRNFFFYSQFVAVTRLDKDLKFVARHIVEDFSTDKAHCPKILSDGQIAIAGSSASGLSQQGAELVTVSLRGDVRREAFGNIEKPYDNVRYTAIAEGAKLARVVGGVWYSNESPGSKAFVRFLDESGDSKSGVGSDVGSGGAETIRLSDVPNGDRIVVGGSSIGKGKGKLKDSFLEIRHGNGSIFRSCTLPNIELKDFVVAKDGTVIVLASLNARVQGQSRNWIYQLDDECNIIRSGNLAASDEGEEYTAVLAIPGDRYAAIGTSHLGSLKTDVGKMLGAGGPEGAMRSFRIGALPAGDNTPKVSVPTAEAPQMKKTGSGPSKEEELTRTPPKKGPAVVHMKEVEASELDRFTPVGPDERLPWDATTSPAIR